MRESEVRVHTFIRAPVERVFDAITDHESFIRDRLTTTRVVRPGAPEPNAVGARREVRAGGIIRFIEEVTAWQRPSSYDYLILECTLPIRHRAGRMIARAFRGFLESAKVGSSAERCWRHR